MLAPEFRTVGQELKGFFLSPLSYLHWHYSKKNLEGVIFAIVLSQQPFKNAWGYGEQNCQNVEVTLVDLSVIDQEQ